MEFSISYFIRHFQNIIAGQIIRLMTSDGGYICIDDNLILDTNNVNMARISVKRILTASMAVVVIYLIGVPWINSKGSIAKRQVLKSGFSASIGNKDQEVGKAWLERMDEKHKARKEAVRKACMDHFNISLKSVSSLAANPSRLRPLIVSDEHHFIYSIVYKVGSTNWERVLVEDLGGFKNVPNQKLYSHKALHWMIRYNSTEIENRLTSYKTFIFVRNPLARILSAYRDKFVDHHNSVFTRMGKNIIQLYRDHNQVTTENVSFTEFVKYLVDSAAHRSNPHWKPIFNQNFPCEMNFDIIGKLEEASDDIPYVLKSLHIDHLVKYAQGKPKKTSEKSLLATYYSQLSRDLLQKLCAIYKADFVIFGYDIPDSFS